MNQNIITATKQNHKKWPSDTNQLVESYKFTSPETFTETNRLQNPFYAGSSKTENLGHDLSILSSWFFFSKLQVILVAKHHSRRPILLAFFVEGQKPIGHCWRCIQFSTCCTQIKDYNMNTKQSLLLTTNSIEVCRSFLF